MLSVAVISQKGGAGKTTCAVCLAVAHELAGGRAVVVDLDPQGSACTWSDLREADRPSNSLPSMRCHSSRAKRWTAASCSALISSASSSRSAAGTSYHGAENPCSSADLGAVTGHLARSHGATGGLIGRRGWNPLGVT